MVWNFSPLEIHVVDQNQALINTSQKITKAWWRQRKAIQQRNGHCQVTNSELCWAWQRTNAIVSLFGFLMSPTATRLSRGRTPRLTSDNFTCCHTEIERGDHDCCLSLPHYTDTDPNWERGLNPRPPDQESRALSTEIKFIGLNNDYMKKWAQGARRLQVLWIPIGAR